MRVDSELQDRLKYNTAVRKKATCNGVKKMKRKPRSEVDGFGGTEHEKNVLNGFVAVGKFNEIGKTNIWPEIKTIRTDKGNIRRV